MHHIFQIFLEPKTVRLVEKAVRLLITCMTVLREIKTIDRFLAYNLLIEFKGILVKLKNITLAILVEFGSYFFTNF